MKKNIFILVFLVLIICGCGNKNNISYKIDYTSAKEKLDNGAMLVDVRTKEEYDENHIDGAILLPVDSINSDTVTNVFPDKNSIIIVYCRSGNRSSRALILLNNLGYNNVYDLGSINNWRQ